MKVEYTLAKTVGTDATPALEHVTVVEELDFPGGTSVVNPEIDACGMALAAQRGAEWYLYAWRVLEAGGNGEAPDLSATVPPEE